MRNLSQENLSLFTVASGTRACTHKDSCIETILRNQTCASHRPMLARIHLIYTKISLTLHHALVQYNDQLSHTAGHCTTHFIIWLNIVQLGRTNLLYIFNVGVIDNV